VLYLEQCLIPAICNHSINVSYYKKRKENWKTELGSIHRKRGLLSIPPTLQHMHHLPPENGYKELPPLPSPGSPKV
jgi:hypothetical protein